MSNIYWDEDNRPDELGKKELQTFTMHITPKLPPKEVGGYDITGGDGKANSIVFNFVRKPSWLNRTCCRIFLGWKWNDKK